jgi:hypothetical protein
MAIPSKQIGWGTTENLLWQIAKQLETLTKVAGNAEPVGPTTTTTSTSSTTTTTTTVAPGPTPSYTGTIGVTTTPGNELFRFSISARNLESTMNVSINWGDNTSDTYIVGSGSAIYPDHTYATSGVFTATITIDDPSLINTIIIDHLSAESPAIPTAYNFSDFNGLASIIASNTVLHTADTAGLTTLNSLTINNADLESLALVNCDSLQVLSAHNNNLSVLDLTSATVLSYADLHNNELVGLDIDNATALTYLNLDDNALVQANVDAILLALVANNQTNGTVNLTGVANDAPSSTGLSAKATLEARGWTVTVNTSSSVQSTLMYWSTGYYENAYQGITHFNVPTNKYRLFTVYELPRTVYYTGALGVNTVLWTNPEMTEFNISFGGYPYAALIFSDEAIIRNDVNSSLQIYQISVFNQNNLVYLNPGTVATISWNYNHFKGSNTVSPCDVEWQEDRFLYYNGTPTLSLDALVAENFNNGDWYWYGRNYITQYTGGTSVYQLTYGSNGKQVTAITACTFTPTFTNATWGYTRQDAIDGVNTFDIRPAGPNPYNPPTDFTFIGCDGIKLANGNIGEIVSGIFWVAYDGMVKQFYCNYYEVAGYDKYNAPAVDVITPPVTPYEIVVTPGGSYCDQFNSSNTITLYSNFPVITKYATAYTDPALTIFPTWDWYTMENNPAGYMYYYKWFYYQPCQ